MHTVTLQNFYNCLFSNIEQTFQVKAVCRAMLDAARLLYAPRPAPNQSEGGDVGCIVDSKFAIKQEVSTLQNTC